MSACRSISRPWLFMLGLIGLYALIIGPFSTYMRAKPIEEKLGYVPSIKVIRAISADHKELLGAGLVMKVMMYFGGLVDQNDKAVAQPPDYVGMSRMLHGAVKLDPYNMDAYYFAQAFLVWDVGQIKVANDLLDYGMQYRTWDWYLPYFAGFNHGYFLKEYDKAASYYKKAGELTGEPLFISLTGRYLQEAGQTGMAIGYLKGMLASARDELARKSFATRLKAFEEVHRIELARDRYVKETGRLPVNFDELLKGGDLVPPPVDPYGGVFTLDAAGKVSTTSQFAFGVKHKKDADEKH